MSRQRAAAVPAGSTLSWDAATTATVAIARMTITILFAAGIAAHAVVFLALPVGIIYDIRRTMSKSVDVSRAKLAHSRAVVRATGCHPPLPPVGDAAAAAAYVATIAAHEATYDSVVNVTAAGLAGLFGDGFTPAVAALTHTHWAICAQAAVGVADAERVVRLPIDGVMVATAIGRTLAAGLAALGPVTTIVVSMATSFWIFPSLSVSMLLLSGVVLVWRLSNTVDKWTGSGGGRGGRGWLSRGSCVEGKGAAEWDRDARFADTCGRRGCRGKDAAGQGDDDAASAGEADECEADDSPRSSAGTQSPNQATAAAEVSAAPAVGWVWKLLSMAAEKGRQRGDPDDEAGIRSSIDGGRTAVGVRLAAADEEARGSGGSGGGNQDRAQRDPVTLRCGGDVQGRAQRNAVTLDKGAADVGDRGRHRDAVVASDGEELRPAADERWGVMDEGADEDPYDDEWDGYDDDDDAVDDTVFPADVDDVNPADAGFDDVDPVDGDADVHGDYDDDDDAGDDSDYAADGVVHVGHDYDDYATDDIDYPADGGDSDESGRWEEQYPADRGADRRHRPVTALDRRHCADDDAVTIPSDGEVIGGDARRRRGRRRAASPPPPLLPPTLPRPPTPPLPSVAPRAAAVRLRRTTRRRTATQR